MKNVNITIINDCRDANAAGRQIARVAALLGSSVFFIGVPMILKLQAISLIFSTLLKKIRETVLVNVALRSGKAKSGKIGN